MPKEEVFVFCSDNRHGRFMVIEPPTTKNETPLTAQHDFHIKKTARQRAEKLIVFRALEPGS